MMRILNRLVAPLLIFACMSLSACFSDGGKSNGGGAAQPVDNTVSLQSVSASGVSPKTRQSIALAVQNLQTATVQFQE